MSVPSSASPGRQPAVHAAVTIAEHERLARDTFRLRFACPDLARSMLPGQFVMLRLAGYQDPLIGRPLALYDTFLSSNGETTGLDVVYLVKGKLTSRLAECGPGQRLEVWGPLGNGFPPAATNHLVLVAGGIGQTPLLALAQEALGRRQYGDPPRAGAWCSRCTLCYGARSADLLAGVSDFSRAGCDVRLATDDGSRGHRGLVTELLGDVLAEARQGCTVVCCGPEPMMEAVAQCARAAQVACQVSLETPMACGIGICFSCVARVRDAEGGWDYRRTCVDGPVFDAAQIVW